MGFSSIYSQENRKRFLIAAAIFIVTIAEVDWRIKPFISIGFLYLFPILLIAGFLPRWQIALVALVCALLQEIFSELPSNEAFPRLLMASAGFVGTGLFVSEIIRNRQMTLNHLKEVERQIGLRKEIEEQLQGLQFWRLMGQVLSSRQRSQSESPSIWQFSNCGSAHPRLSSGITRCRKNASVTTIPHGT